MDDRRIKDEELREYQEKIGRDKYRKQYHLLYQRTKEAGNKRYSGEHYENTPEKLNRIKEKYKNGVSQEMINQMLGIKG